ncbi:hypothetical protein MUK42_29110 [Musa troglodytarum]|uniref:Uncharacterized protein n=1 Tax=Musa troglodytarum TaxID=320322 RepID=A0A9E7JV72_9LILI|nr:hypothetical protein MUK42_29110 [Musa troglodytarum]
MGCFQSKGRRHYPGYEDPVLLASQTALRRGIIGLQWKVAKKWSAVMEEAADQGSDSIGSCGRQRKL